MNASEVMMTEKTLLEDKNVLIVDDEPDVLDTLEELLGMCQLTRAGSFEEAKKLLESQSFDLAVLDIMGVDGFSLLDMAYGKRVLAVMLTAHALTPENTIKSYKMGAAYFIPKEKMTDIADYLNDVLLAVQEKQNYWNTWMERVGQYYDERFGAGWKDDKTDFWTALAKKNWKMASEVLI
jgi:DNA-binding NtrC family response regulator